MIINEKNLFSHIFVISHGDFLNSLVGEILGVKSPNVIFFHSNASVTHLSAHVHKNKEKEEESEKEKEKEKKEKGPPLVWGPLLSEISQKDLSQIRRQWETDKHKIEFVVQTLGSPHKM